MTPKPMHQQTVEDFPPGRTVSISFSDAGIVVGHVTVLEFGTLLAVLLADNNGAQSSTGMRYRLVLVHPTNITYDCTHQQPHIPMAFEQRAS